MISIIAAVLALIEQLLPLITSSENAKLIDSIINTLSKMLPFIINEISSLYAPIKNIIAALSANPATLSTQQAQLQALDKQCDDAFEAIAAITDADVSTSAGP